MDFELMAVDTAKRVEDQLNYILNLRISPDDKLFQIGKLMKVVGTAFYSRGYAAIASVLDSAAIVSSTADDFNDRTERLAQKVLRDHSLGRATDRTIKNFFDAELGLAQDEAFKNAVSMERHPTMTRSLGGEKNCDWCIAKAGTHTRPGSELFARHAGCDCKIVVSGYNTRNGLIKNFAKGR